MAEGNDSFTKKLKLKVEVAKDSVKEITKESTTKITKSFNSVMTNIVGQFTSAITGAFSNAIDTMQELLSYSRLSNANTRNLMLTYGFSNAQAYGFDKALESIGLSSEEDLMYSTSQELSFFRKSFEKYSNYYTKLYDSGFFDKIREYNYEMEEFKQELQLQVVEFFVNNKDSIKWGMQALMTIANVIMKIFSWLVGTNADSSTATVSDVVSQYNTTTGGDTSVKVSNTFNGVQAKDENTLSNAGSLTYEQVIRALGGK